MKVPVIPGIGPEKIQSFLDFATEIRENPMRVAEIEAERLLPYLDAITQQLKEDIQDYKKIPAVEMDAPPPIGNAQDIKDRVAELNSAQGLSSLFTNISRKTNSTILSEMLVLSAGVVGKLRQEDGIQWFGKNDYFNRSSIALGFLQIEKGAGDANISVPYAAIDEDIMSILGKTDTTKLLQLLQRALLAGNHDMQHHYTNDYLNETIIGRQHSLPKSARHQNSVEKWSRKYFDSFNDEAANSYESWLIMNHAKAMEKALKNGERGELEVMVRDYYNELGRIKDALIPDTTEDERKRAIDFMGMLVPYALMRFLPLDDPLITDCFKRLEEIAIDKDQPFLGTENSVEDVVKYTLELPEYTRIVENYKHAGRPIAPNNTADYDFVAIKKMQLIRMAPAIPYLLSPSDNDEHLKKMQDRVGHINVEMISDVSHNIWFSPVENGTWTTTDDTGARITIHSQNGQPHNLEGPAIIIEFDDQQRKEIYCENGKLRTNGPPIVSYTLGLQEKLYRNEHFLNQYGGLSVLHSE